MLVAPLLVLATSLFPLASAVTQTSPAKAVASPDGTIVPFSTLPACASLCGPLFDVQGACVASTTESCFCSDARLTPFDQGTSGVQSVCGAASCTDTADLTAIKTWYDGYCKKSTSTSSSSSPTASATSTSTSNPTPAVSNKTWIQSHYGWVIFIVVVGVAMIGGWITASYFRRRYLRNKEKEIELQRPVSWGPHQMQAMTGGFNGSEGQRAGQVSGTISPEVREVGAGPLK